MLAIRLNYLNSLATLSALIYKYLQYHYIPNCCIATRTYKECVSVFSTVAAVDTGLHLVDTERLDFLREGVRSLLGTLRVVCGERGGVVALAPNLTASLKLETFLYDIIIHIFYF